MTNLGVLPLITAIQKEKKGTEKLRERQTEQHKLSKPAPSADITGSKVAINHETWLQYGELLPQLTSPPCNPINVPVMDDSAWWRFCPWPPGHTHAFTLKGYSVYTCSCVSYALGHSVADTCLLRNVRYDNTGLLLFCPSSVQHTETEELSNLLLLNKIHRTKPSPLKTFHSPWSLLSTFQLALISQNDYNMSILCTTNPFCFAGIPSMCETQHWTIKNLMS